MSRGGYRSNAGRRIGVPNKNRAGFLELIRKEDRIERLVNKLMELAEGVKVKKGRSIYLKPPDAHAATWLLEQAFGKATQYYGYADEEKQREDAQKHDSSIEEYMKAHPECVPIFDDYIRATRKQDNW